MAKQLILYQSYEIKSPPWTILWFRILGTLSVENIARLDVFMFKTSDNSQLWIDSQYSSQYLTIIWSLKNQNTQPMYIFFRVTVLHLDRLKEGTWFHWYYQTVYSIGYFALNIHPWTKKPCILILSLIH